MAKVLCEQNINRDYFGFDSNGQLVPKLYPAPTTSSFSQDNTTGVLTHEDGNGNTILSSVVSGDGSNASNSITVWPDGWAFFEHVPSSLTQDDTTGVITHDNGVDPVTTADVVSADAGNAITVGSDGGSYYSPTGGAWNTSSLTQTVNSDGTKSYVHDDGTGTTQDFCTGFTIVDEDGNTAVVDCDNPMTLDPDLHVTQWEVGGMTLWVSFARSGQAAVSGITTNHTRTVISWANLTASWANSTAIAGQNNTASGSYTVALWGQSSTATGRSSWVTWEQNNSTGTNSFTGWAQNNNSWTTSFSFWQWNIVSWAWTWMRWVSNTDSSLASASRWQGNVNSWNKSTVSWWFNVNTWDQSQIIWGNSNVNDSENSSIIGSQRSIITDNQTAHNNFIWGWHDITIDGWEDGASVWSVRSVATSLSGTASAGFYSSWDMTIDVPAGATRGNALVTVGSQNGSISWDISYSGIYSSDFGVVTHDVAVVIASNWLASVRDNQLHTDNLYVNLVWQGRIYVDDAAAWAAWLLQNEIYGDNNGFVRYKQ